MNHKNFKKYYSVDKAENRWQGIMGFVILFLSISILCATGVYFWISQNIQKDPLPKIETDLQRIESLELRFEDIDILK